MDSSLVLILLAAAGGVDNDLVSFLDAEPYFQSRKVAVNVGEMVARAGQEPKDGKTQVEQLLALRWLGEHPEMVRKDAKVLAVLGEIAAGKKAQDAQRFAREYAARALARIDGKEPPARPIPADSLRAEAFAWFPPGDAGVALLAGLDVRASGKMNVPAARRLRRVVPELLFGSGRQEEDRATFYEAAGLSGNIRLDRLAVCAQTDRKRTDGKERVVLRATGAFDNPRLTALLRAQEGNEVKQVKGPSGEPITFVRYPFIFNASFYFVLVGDTDALLLCCEPADGALPFAELEEVLAVRAGKKASVLKGPLADLLKQLPDQAVAAVVGELSTEARGRLRKMSAPELSPLIPQRFVFHATRDTGLRLIVRTAFPDADEARTCARGVEGLVGVFRRSVKSSPPDLKLPPATVALLDKALDGVKAEARESAVTLDVVISAELIGALGALVEENLKK